MTAIFPIAPTVGLGGPAQTVADGLDTYSTSCNIGARMAAVEIDESTSPMVVLWRRIQPSSGGGGTRRGGQGRATAFAIRGADEMNGTAFNSVAEVPPRGAGGGFPGAASHYHIVRRSRLAEFFDEGIMPTLDNLGGEVEVMPAKTGRLTVRENDVFVIVSGGGGGLGGDPDLVAKDVSDGHRTPEAARVVYRLVTGDGAADVDATVAERRRQREERLGRPPAREACGAVSSEIGIAVVLDGSYWKCAECGEDLGRARGNYRDLRVERIQSAPEALRAWGMQLRERTAPPTVVVRSYFCPGCGSSVRVDVGLEGDERSPAPQIVDVVA